MNAAQAEAIRQANAYLSNVGLKTYSELTGTPVPDEQMTVDEEARFDWEIRQHEKAEHRAFGPR